MQRANINDRSTIEGIYPRAVFMQESNANARAQATVRCGVRIGSAPDASGAFDLVRASRHAGEPDSGNGAVFLSPVAQETGHGADYPAAASGDAGTRPRDAYGAFIDEIIAAARSAHAAPAPGRGDMRLRGLRQ